MWRSSTTDTTTNVTEIGLATMTAPDAARILGVHPGTIRNWMTAGKLEYGVTATGLRQPYVQAVHRMRRERGVTIRWRLSVKANGQDRGWTDLTWPQVAKRLMRWVRHPDIEQVTLTREKYERAWRVEDGHYRSYPAAKPR